MSANTRMCIASIASTSVTFKMDQRGFMLCIKLLSPHTLFTTTLTLKLRRTWKSEILTTMRHICFSFVALSAFIIVGSSAGLASQGEKQKCVLSPGASPCPKCLGCLDRCETQLIEAVDECSGVDIGCVNKFVEKSAKECLDCTGYLCFGLHLPQCWPNCRIILL